MVTRYILAALMCTQHLLAWNFHKEDDDDKLIRITFTESGKLAKQYGLSPFGQGRLGPGPVTRGFSLDLQSHKKASIQEARELLIQYAESLTERINTLLHIQNIAAQDVTPSFLGIAINFKDRNEDIQTAAGIVSRVNVYNQTIKYYEYDAKKYSFNCIYSEPYIEGYMTVFGEHSVQNCSEYQMPPPPPLPRPSLFPKLNS